MPKEPCRNLQKFPEEITETCAWHQRLLPMSTFLLLTHSRLHRYHHHHLYLQYCYKHVRLHRYHHHLYLQYCYKHVRLHRYHHHLYLQYCYIVILSSSSIFTILLYCYIVIIIYIYNIVILLYCHHHLYFQYC